MILDYTTIMYFGMFGLVIWYLSKNGESIRESIIDFKSWFTIDLYYAIVKYDTFVGLDTEKLDDVYNLIVEYSGISSWDMCDVIEKKLGINEMQRYKLLKALQNEGRIHLVHDNHGFGYYHTDQIVQVQSGDKE